MDIFENLKDIEKVYEDLINNAKKLNLKDIEDFRSDQDKKFEQFIKKKNELVNTTLGNLAIEVDGEIKTFEKQLNNAIKKIEMHFQKNIGKLHKLIIEEVGLDF